MLTLFHSSRVLPGLLFRSFLFTNITPALRDARIYCDKTDTFKEERERKQERESNSMETGPLAQYVHADQDAHLSYLSSSHFTTFDLYPSKTFLTMYLCNCLFNADIAPVSTISSDLFLYTYHLPDIWIQVSMEMTQGFYRMTTPTRHKPTSTVYNVWLSVTENNAKLYNYKPEVLHHHSVLTHLQSALELRDSFPDRKTQRDYYRSEWYRIRTSHW